MKEFSLVVATDVKNGIGKNGTLPWKLSGDMKYFRQLTTRTEKAGQKNAVIMGRKTWESIPEKFRPLPGRLNIVLSRQKDMDLPVDVFQACSFEEVFHVLSRPPASKILDKVFVIGGGQVYKEALQYKQCRTLYITQVLKEFDCDAFFGDYHLDYERKKVSPPQQEGNISYYFSEYQKASQQ